MSQLLDRGPQSAEKVYRTLLMKISNYLSKEDLKNLLFCCEDSISEAKAEKIESGTDLFRALKHQNLLGPDNYDYLREHLLTIGRVDLASELPTPLQTVLATPQPQSVLYKVTTSQLSRIASHSFLASGDTSRDQVSSKPIKNPTASISPTNIISDSPRAQLLRVSDHLTADDVSKLTYLFADKLSINGSAEKSQTESPIQLLFSLEAVGVISSSHPETLVGPLQEIGRKDLAVFLQSHHFLPSLLSSLDNSHQLLQIKMSMLRRKQTDYCLHRKAITVAANCDPASFKKHLLVPAYVKSALLLYDYSTISCLSLEARTAIPQVKEFERMLCSTLSDAYSFIEAYFEYSFYFLKHERVNVTSAESYVQACRSCYSRFEKNVSQVKWNTAFQTDVRNESTERKSPLGRPELKAIACIYEVCSELYGGNAIESAMKSTDQKLYILEFLHYMYCYRMVTLQWIMTVLFFLANDESSSQVRPCDLTHLRTILLDIANKYKNQINSIYPSLSSMIGESLAKKLCDKLNSEGINIGFKFGHSGFVEEYFASISLSVYCCLLLLLYISYFGNDGLDLSGIFSRLKQFYSKFYCSDVYVLNSVAITGNRMRAVEVCVKEFRDKALKANPLCSSVVGQIFSIND